MWKISVFLLLLTCAVQVDLSKVSDKEKDNSVFFEDTVSKEELQILPKFRSQVKHLLTQKAMFENAYLVRYLRARNNNLKEAERMLIETYEWRQSYNADNSANYTDWTWWHRSYPFKLTEDKSHRPALLSGFKDFDLRKVLLSGKRDELRQYIIYVLDKCVNNLNRVSKLFKKDFNSGYLIFNMNGYTTRNHACLACIPTWIELATSYENYYPQLASHIIAVNTPRLFQSLFEVLKPFITEHTRRVIRLYGVDRGEWQPVLDKYFDRTQLLKEFGGTLNY